MADLKTILFDLDGVVIDSEPIHAKAKKIVLEQFNITYPPTVFDDYKGKTDKVFWDYVSGNLDSRQHSAELLQDSKKLVFVEIIKELRIIDDFFFFIDIVKRKGIQTALVSSTSLYSLGLIDDLYHISELFDLVITEADTPLHKPYPHPYLKAMEILPADPPTCIVIEDSPNGIISAKRAGLFVYGMTSSFKRHQLIEAGADVIIGSFKELLEKLEL